MAEYCQAFASQVYELSDRVTDEQATFLDPIIAAMHAVDVAGPRTARSSRHPRRGTHRAADRPIRRSCTAPSAWRFPTSPT